MTDVTRPGCSPWREIMANTAENVETAVVSALNIYREEFFDILERLLEFPSIGRKSEEEFEVGVK